MIELYEQVPSTNDLALEAASEGARAGRCWMADRQTRGRGRRLSQGDRRSWFSPPGANIYASILLRPDLEPSRASGLTLAAGLALAEVVDGRGDLAPWVKWPNDLYVGDDKLGGILTEASSSGGGLDAVVVGFGLNVNLGAGQFDAGLASRATSLQIETDRRWDRLGLMLAIRRRLVDRCGTYVDEGFAAIRPALGEYDRSGGREVRLVRDGCERSGRAAGIADDGRLRVDLAEGDEISVRAGEVEFVGL